MSICAASDKQANDAHENMDFLMYRIKTTEAGVSIWLVMILRQELNSLSMVRNDNQPVVTIINYTIRHGPLRS